MGCTHRAVRGLVGALAVLIRVHLDHHRATVALETRPLAAGGVGRLLRDDPPIRAAGRPQRAHLVGVLEVLDEGALAVAERLPAVHERVESRKVEAVERGARIAQILLRVHARSTERHTARIDQSTSGAGAQTAGCAGLRCGAVCGGGSEAGQGTGRARLILVGHLEARLVADELGGGLAQPGCLHRRQLAQHDRDHVQREGLLDRAQLARVGELHARELLREAVAVERAEVVGEVGQHDDGRHTGCRHLPQRTVVRRVWARGRASWQARGRACGQGARRTSTTVSVRTSSWSSRTHASGVSTTSVACFFVRSWRAMKGSPGAGLPCGQ